MNSDTKLSKYNLTILITMNILRFILGYLLIFKTKIKDIFKIWLLFFNGGLDDLDSFYPSFLGLYKKYNRSAIYLYKQMRNYYIIPDKINDLLTNWMFFYYLKNKKDDKKDDKEILLLLFVLLNRTWGIFLYFSKNIIFKKLKSSYKYNLGDKNLFFYYPDYFSLYCLLFEILKKEKNKGKYILFFSFLKNLQEYYLHVKNK